MEWYKILLIIIVIIEATFLFLILPGNKRKAIKHDWLYENYIAHRGFFNNELGVVENTKTAFLLAVEKKYNIETDISLTYDNEIVVYHDDNFKRLFNVDKKISDMTLKEIKALKYSNSTDDILEFSEFLKLIDGKTGLLIEFKSQSKKRDIILCEKAMEILKDYKGNYAVQSFHPVLVKYFKKKYPFIPRGQLYMKFNLKEEIKRNSGKGFKGCLGVFVKWMYNNKLTNCISRPMFIDHRYQDIDFMAKLSHLFVPMIVFTVDDKDEFENIYSKVDNVIFEKLEIRKNGKSK